jgi:hypothetical protein
LQIGLPGAAGNVAYRLAMLVSMNVVARFSVSLGFSSESLIGHLVGAGHC